MKPINSGKLTRTYIPKSQTQTSFYNHSAQQAASTYHQPRSTIGDAPHINVSPTHKILKPSSVILTPNKIKFA